MNKGKELRTAGLLIGSGIIFFIVSLFVAEALYPGYSISNNYISDLGVGPSANVFNFSIIVLGLLLAGGAYFYSQGIKGKVFPVLIGIAGIAAIGVGIFNEHFGVIHVIFSFIVFFFGGIAAVYYSAREKNVIKYPSAVLGIIGLIALGLFTSDIYLGIGPGGMERMIVYPLLLWGVLLSGRLLAA